MYVHNAKNMDLYLVAMHKREPFSLIGLLKSPVHLMIGVYGCLWIPPSKDHEQNKYTIYYTSIFSLNAELHLAVMKRSIRRPLL
jgi:hypothetical protein